MDYSRVDLRDAGWEGLLKSIVYQAVQDYKTVLSGQRHETTFRETVQDQKDKLMRFFHSKWYSMLTDIPAETLIRELEGQRRSDMRTEA